MVLTAVSVLHRLDLGWKQMEAVWIKAGEIYCIT